MAKLSIFESFNRTFGRLPADDSLRSLPVDSVCGSDCQRVITAARTLMDEMVAARGRDEQVAALSEQLAAMAEDIITIYWRG